MREDERILRNKKYFLRFTPTLLDMPVGHCRRISPFLSAQNCRIKTRPKQNRFPGHFWHSRLPSRSWSGALPPQAAWPGETHSAPSADSLLTRVGLAIRTLTHVRRTGPTRANECINKSVTLTGTVFHAMLHDTPHRIRNRVVRLRCVR